jgi:putative addiction module CopG family antidote
MQAGVRLDNRQPPWHAEKSNEIMDINIYLSDGLEQFVQAKVRSGRFTSSDEAIAAGVRPLRQQEEAEDARTLDGIRQGLEDVRAGRTQPLAEAFAEIRPDLGTDREFRVLPHS